MGIGMRVKQHSTRIAEHLSIRQINHLHCGEGADEGVGAHVVVLTKAVSQKVEGSLSEKPETAQTQENAPVASGKLLKQYGKFQRKNLKTGNTEKALAVFLVASVLEVKNRKILNEAKGVDDVVKILGDITANLDAKKACTEQGKFHFVFPGFRCMLSCLFGRSRVGFEARK
ncbi:hypothetical protein K1719_005438 [Acacia pycnantha]|nr:hypothetical protein K1719_005438 [Acacia pycnantha]